MKLNFHISRVIPLEVRRRIKLTGVELEEFRQKEKVGYQAGTLDP